MKKKDNIIDFRDYQPGKRETIETNSLDAFRASLFNLGFTAPSSSDTLDESKEVEPKVEETEPVSASEVVEEPTVEVEVEETIDPVAEEETSETDDGKSMVDETEPDDEPEVVESEDDDSDEEVIIDADFREVDFDPEEEDSSEFEEEPHISKTHTSFGRFFKKFEKTNFAERILANFGFSGETPAVQPSKADDEESKAEDSTTKADSPQFNSRAQELLSKEIMDGKVDKLNEWSKNDNVNKLMFLFSGNPVLSDWIMENEPDIFWDLPDEIIDVILEKDKKSSEKKDDKDEKKS